MEGRAAEKIDLLNEAAWYGSNGSGGSDEVLIIVIPRFSHRENLIVEMQSVDQISVIGCRDEKGGGLLVCSLAVVPRGGGES